MDSTNSVVTYATDSFLPNDDWSNVLQISDGPFPEPNEASKRRLFQFKLHQSRYGPLENYGIPRDRLWESYEYFLLRDKLFKNKTFVNGCLHDVHGRIHFLNGVIVTITLDDKIPDLNPDLRWLLSEDWLTLIYAPHTQFPLKKFEETISPFSFKNIEGVTTIFDSLNFTHPTFCESNTEFETDED